MDKCLLKKWRPNMEKEPEYEKTKLVGWDEANRPDPKDSKESKPEP